MKFVIQKIENEIRHDFAFELLESIRFHNWLHRNHDPDHAIVRYLNTEYNDMGLLEDPVFKPYQKSYIPIGTVEFVTSHLQQFYGLTPRPINVPRDLFGLTNRQIFNGTNMSLDGLKGKWFIKDNDKIKGVTKIVEDPDILSVSPNGNYQISEVIGLDSEWRAFVYKGKLVGLQHYVGDFTMFPNVEIIKMMIKDYKSSPIAYTLDVGVFNYCDTFVIEVHDFFSCGLYGFRNHAILPNMFSRWYYEYINKNKINGK